jgi:hypothetical protein
MVDVGDVMQVLGGRPAGHMRRRLTQAGRFNGDPLLGLFSLLGPPTVLAA